jgi:hypothetical protein
MRIPKQFGVRTTIGPREPKKKFFLVFEGEKTEYQYFEGINANKVDLSISALVEIKPLMRSTGHKTTSNPKRIIQQVIRHMTETIGSGISYKSIIEQICDYLFYELEISENSIINSKTITDDLTELSKSKFGILPEDIATDANAVLTEFERHLKSKYNIEHSAELMAEYIKNSEVIFEKGFDRVCIIVDRDKQSFKANQYDYVRQECLKHQFDFCVSNPCFEFWLLLHYPDADKLDKQAILENKRATSKKKLTEKLLSEKLPGYKKNSLNFECIKDKIDLAIKQEKLFCEDIEKLKTDLGTNIGLLITLMTLQDSTNSKT